MSDSNLLQQLRGLGRDVDQVKTIERPGGVTGFDTFYASGSWTPTLKGTTIAGTFTYTNQNGTYTRIGNLVVALGRVSISAITVAPTGNLRIAGLPITPDTLSAGKAGTTHINDWNGVTFTAGYTYMGGWVVNATTEIALTESGSNVADIFLPAANLILVGGNSEFNFTATYRV